MSSQQPWEALQSGDIQELTCGMETLPTRHTSVSVGLSHSPGHTLTQALAGARVSAAVGN